MVESFIQKGFNLNVIPDYVKKDILWWHTFLPCYNGVSMMLYEEWCSPDSVFSSDSCLQGCGGFGEANTFIQIFRVILNNMGTV